MPWIQIRFQTLLDQVEPLEDLLLELGASAVTLMDGADQPVFEPIRGTTPLWDKTQVIGLFDGETNIEEIFNQIALTYQVNGLALPEGKAEILEDKDWEREWMEHFHPIQCGDRLWITPSWREPPDENAVNLMLDPGLAFGTGTHPTTFMCLKWLDKHDALVKDAKVVDYGCGSGILGIASLLLGATNFVGVDNDPQAIIATKENALRNKIDESTYTVHLPEDFTPFQADIVLANILAGPLISLNEGITGTLKSGGKLVLSGILNHQYQQVIDAYSHCIDFDPIKEQDEWVCLSGTKK
ncbi:50S ribosomal protein L11 methyltransferase [Marinicellulosiphila megalodicopiae]|uniref:50S ribosomal protein L11 methyltransferase n=1 Tax=Marinicellulosiphila megalodicopiae TaxID=2724896 RepID=UPI003BAE338C